MEGSEKNTSLILAIIFATVVIGGSLVFLGIQMSSQGQASILNSELLARLNKLEKVEKLLDQIEQNENPQVQNLSPPDLENDHILGDKNAEISLIEYSDYECPFCVRFHPIVHQLVEAYRGKVNWIYRHFILSYHNPNSSLQATAAECAAELEGDSAFWEMTDLIYKNTQGNKTGPNREKLLNLADKMGLQKDPFTTCLDSGKFAAALEKSQAEGSSAGVQGTPGGILLNNKTGETVMLKGAEPFEDVKSKIDALMEE